jgi:hypothetical protein
MLEAYFALSDGSSKKPFIILLRGAELVAHARAILRGNPDLASHVHGNIVATPAFYNPDWSFHLDPSSIGFFQVAIEVCDANIAYVEEKLIDVGTDFLPGNHWCPWSAKLTAEISLPAKSRMCRPGVAETSVRAKELFSIYGLPLSPAGWVARLDAGLAAEPSLGASELAKRAATLNPRWTEVYIQDMRSSLGGLEIDSRYFDDLSFRLANQVLDLKAQDEALRIHNDEIVAGYYTVASEISQSELTATNAQLNGYAEASAQYEKLFQNHDAVEVFEDPQRAAELRAVAASVLVYSPYQKLHDDFSKNGFLMWPKGWNTVGVPTPLPPGTIGEDPTSTPSLVYFATRKSAMCEISSAAVAATSGRLLADAGSKSAASSLAAKTREAKWAADDVNFRRDRAEVQINLRELRRQAVESVGGPLNLTEKCLTLRKRFVEQLAETLARATVVGSSLQPVYGVTWSTAPPDVASWDDAYGGYLAALQAWYVGLDTTLARAQERESAQIVVVSMKGSSPKEFAAAKAALKAGTSPKLLVPFKITPQQVGDLRGARVRALSISTIEKGPDIADSWRGRVRPPIAAISVDLLGNHHLIIQQGSFVAEAGRICSRTSPRQPDTVGANLRNCCPTSDLSKPDAASNWALEVEPLSLLGKHAYDLEDVVVEVVITGLASY